MKQRHNSMKKSTIIITVILIVLVASVVGYYAYLSGKSKSDTEKNTTMTAVQNILSRDMEYDYPSTPKEVLKYYNEIQKCFYNGNCSDNEIEQLGIRARDLYDEELLANNELGEYLMRLKSEIQSYRDKKRLMTSAAVTASTNVDFFEEDDNEFARIFCSYSIVEGKDKIRVNQVFLLRRDEKRRWKIYGWDSADNVDPQ